MTSIKDYIGKQFINHIYRFKCDCIIPFDISGTVKDYEISGNEIILIVQTSSKLMHIGLNTNALMIEQLY